MTLIEQIGDDFGVTVRYEFDEHKAVSVNFFAVEVLGVEDNGTKVYWRKGASSSTDDTCNPAEAERYVDGSVKWDGCSHYYFGDESGYLHCHGIADIEKLHEILSAIYQRCGALMKASGANTLHGEFIEG